MRQTLFHIPYDVCGVPLFGVGLLLALWLVAGLVGLAWMARRGRLRADLTGAVPPMLVVGAAIWLLPRLFPGALPIRGYGVMLLAGALAGVGLAIHRARQVGLDAEVISSLAIWLLIPGILGARLFHVVEYWEAEYRRDSVIETLKAVLNVPQGGLVVYGSLIGAALGLVAFVRLRKLPLLAVADLIAPSLPLGLALGRIGCLLNGCCFGGPCDLPWAVTFPEGSPPYQAQIYRGQLFGFELEGEPGDPPVVVRVQAGSAAESAGLRSGDRLVRVDGRPVAQVGDVQRALAEAFHGRTPLRLTRDDRRRIELPAAEHRPRSLPVHPTQLYSAVTALLLCLLLWNYYPLRSRDGEVTALMLTLYPLLRFLLEAIRTDEPVVFLTGLSISQNISGLLLVGVVGLWIYVLRQPKRGAGTLLGKDA